MGHQQLLILVLGIVVCIVTAYTGVDNIKQLMQHREADTLLNYAVNVASEAVAWRGKGSSFLGGGSSYENLGKQDLGQLKKAEMHALGKVQITFASADSLVITAVSTNDDSIGVQVLISGTEIVKTIAAYDGSIQLPD